MMNELLTVIVQTSPLPSHPSTALLEALFRSFDRVTHLKECNIFILADGCEDDKHFVDKKGGAAEINEKKNKSVNYKHGTVSQDTASDYRLHLHLLQNKIDNQHVPFNSSGNGTIQLLKLPHRHGSARAISAAFEILSVHTPYVLIAQHDNFFVRDVTYLQQLINYMEIENTKSWLQCVHFPSTATLNYVQKVKRRYGLDIQQLCKKAPQDMSLIHHGVFIPLVFWYGRTHIARTKYYTEKILCEFTLKAGDHLEELWGTKQLNEVLELKKYDDFEKMLATLHATYGNYVFFDIEKVDEQHEVLYHMSGRKVRAAAPVTSNDAVHSDDTESKSENATSLYPQEKSFTTARRAMAVVPGLDSIDDGKVKSSKPQTKFRQRCFHCGEKGHSFKFCPQKCMPEIETLIL